MTEPIEKYSTIIEGFDSMTFQQRREAVAEHPNLMCSQHNRTTLKELFRFKPKKGEVSEYSYKGVYGKVDCWRLNQCVAMRELPNKSRTAKQKQATKNLIETNLKNSYPYKASLLANQLIDNDVIVLDCETTDLDGVVIQIALVSCKTGELIFESLVHTDEPISDEAANIHGITQDMLTNAPSFDEVSQAIYSILDGREWTAYNSSFDYSALKRSVTRNPELEHYNWLEDCTHCVMYDIAVKFCGSTNKYGTISLANSLSSCGLGFVGQAHDAASDSLSTVRLIEHIAQYSKQSKN